MKLVGAFLNIRAHNGKPAATLCHTKILMAQKLSIWNATADFHKGCRCATEKPLATILSGAMMLDWLGTTRDDPAALAAGKRIESAVAQVLVDGRVRTPDLGGTAGTKAVGEAVVRAIEEGPA